MTYRIFVGKLSDRTSDSSLRQAFEEFGEVKSVEIKGGYAFVYFDQAHSAEEAIEKMNGRELDGSVLVVENARGSAARHDAYPKNNIGGGRLVRRLDLRVLVKDLPRSVSWQDLKDWARNAGDVTYTNVFFDQNNEYFGVIEYKDDATLDKALRILEDIPIKNNRVRIEKDDPGASHHNIPPNRGSFEPRGRGGFSGRGPPPGGRRDGYEDGYDRRIPPREGRERSRSRGGGMDRGGYHGGPPPGYNGYEGRGGYHDERMRGPYGGDYRDDPRGPPPPSYRDRSRSRSRSRSPHGRYPGWAGPDSRGPPPADYGRGGWSGYEERGRGRSPVGRYYDYDRR